MRASNCGALLSLLMLASCVTGQTRYAVTVPSPIAGDTGRLTAWPADAAPSPAPHDRRGIVLADAEQLVGTRYRYGGSTPERGFDCSGFVQWVFSRQGIELPRTSRAMSKSGVRIAARRAVLLPGDLLFFAEQNAAISHVAIYAGDGRIIHASSGQGVVRYDDLDSARGEWFRRHVVRARRVILADDARPTMREMTDARARVCDERCMRRGVMLDARIRMR